MPVATVSEWVTTEKGSPKIIFAVSNINYQYAQLEPLDSEGLCISVFVFLSFFAEHVGAGSSGVSHGPRAVFFHSSFKAVLLVG